MSRRGTVASLDWDIFWEWVQRIAALITIVTIIAQRRHDVAFARARFTGTKKKVWDFLLGRPGSGGPHREPIVRRTVGFLFHLGVWGFVVATLVRWLL